MFTTKQLVLVDKDTTAKYDFKFGKAIFCLFVEMYVIGQFTQILRVVCTHCRTGQYLSVVSTSFPESGLLSTCGMILKSKF